jgi:putative tryptophan/tyrosine transport system substrate-binding protein
MDRRTFVLVAAGSIIVGPLADALAQQQANVWRIGILETTSSSLNAANLSAFREGLRDLGYVEGRNIVIEYRSADGRVERFPALANELVGSKVDVIVTRGTPASLAAKNATRTIPIVIANAGDPVGMGLVTSLARPGGNITGLSSLTVDIEAKRVALLQELVPGLARIALLSNMGISIASLQWKAIETATRSAGIHAQLLDVRSPADFEHAFDAASEQRAQALIVGQDVLLQANRKQVVELAAKHRLPAIYRSMEFIEVGGLMAYGPNYPELYRNAATYVDKILKGAKPEDLPVQQPTKFELVINLKTARALAITIPQPLLLRADEVIQ